ncbi:Tn3 family transposase [Streptomyces sp. NPDC059153]|uniref:Tn3 family transposase n=1 Tax=Streptomyces sp. NPDC059153 TaxID=3346743 RepID=UPI0036BACDEB
MPPSSARPAPPCARRPPQADRRRSARWRHHRQQPRRAGEDREVQRAAHVRTNAVIFHNALEIAEFVLRLHEEGHVIDPEDLAHIPPYLTEHIRRFGEYSTHEPGRLRSAGSEAYDPHLDVDFTLPRGDDPPGAVGCGQAARHGPPGSADRRAVSYRSTARGSRNHWL